MYAASGNLSRTFIAEQLINVAREVDNAVAVVSRLISGSKLPEYQVVDKAFRQEVAMSKRSVETYSSRLLEYIASGRIELVDSKDLILGAVRIMESIVYNVESALYRLVLLKKHGIEELPRINEEISAMLRVLSSMTSEITSITRLLSRIGSNRETMRMLERRVDQVVQAEADVDRLYREALDALIASSPTAAQAMLYKDALDSLEAAADAVKDLAESFRILARSYEAGSPI